ncbi:MAG: AMP-binding protein [Elusimicrobiota bacterium]
MLTAKDYIIRDKVGYKTVLEMVENSCKKFSKKIVMQIKVDGIYQKYTYQDLWNNLNNIASALIKIGFQHGEKAAVYSENRPEWGMAYLGISKAGGVIIPLDVQLSIAELEYILNHSETKVVFTSTKYLDNITEIFDSVKNLTKIICFDHIDEEQNTISLNKFLKIGEESNIHIHHKTEPDDVIAILYTSGTTGIAKGVMLTQKNIISDVELSSQMIYFDENDNFLSVLPIHHSFECTCGFITPLYNGASITYAESLKSKNLIDNIKETKVTVMLGVPLLFEKFYYGIMKGIKEKPLPIQLLFKSSMGIVNITKKLINKKIGRTVFEDLRKKAGLSSVRVFVSGGGPLRADIAEAFDNLGLTILQGYGLTETSPVVAVSTLEYINYYSVGLPLPEIEIKIDKPTEQGIGEILVKGPVVMKGYYKNTEETDEILRDGWLYTGDLGYKDKIGFLYITGRKKNVIVTQGGKNVYPEELEFKINSSDFILESMVYGMPVSEKDRGEKIYAIIVPDYETINMHSKTINKELATEEQIEALISNEVKKINSTLPAYKQISGFKIYPEELIKTSTKKVKRYLYLEKLIPVSSRKK